MIVEVSIRLFILKRMQPLVVVLAILAVLFSGAIYATGQQILRQGANDPQIQMAEDAAAQIASGKQVSIDETKVDIASSLAPFMILYDGDGKVTQSNALLHGQTPTVPPGVIDYVKTHHEDRFTWQPEPGVRLAAVMVSSNSEHAGFALAARNLGEVEKREDRLLLGAVALLVASLLVIGAFALLPTSARK